MDALVRRLDAYGEPIRSTLDWMSEDTKVKALDKLQLNPKIGYPVKWRDYSTLNLTLRPRSSRTCAANAHATDREWAKLGPPDRDEWYMTRRRSTPTTTPPRTRSSSCCDPSASVLRHRGRRRCELRRDWRGHRPRDRTRLRRTRGSRYDGREPSRTGGLTSDRAAFERARLIEQYDAPLHNPAGAGRESESGDERIAPTSTARSRSVRDFGGPHHRMEGLGGLRSPSRG